MKLAERYLRIRAATRRLAAPLSPEDQMVQSMPEASPVKWHLAHTTWFFETFVLGSAAGEPAPRPDFALLYNSYYEAVGPRVARGRRGQLSRPSLEQVHSYRAAIDERVVARLEHGGMTRAELELVELGLAHEEQHQELILTDIKHALWQNPLLPAYRESVQADPAPAASPAGPPAWHPFDERIAEIGAPDGGFAFDNERPRHRALVPGFQLASRLVRASEYLEFMRDGGYDRPALWLSDGWAAVRAQGWRAPLYWQEQDHGDWQIYTLTGLRPIAADEPVCHVSHYEADAFARWAGARLPTELEWEVAAADAGPTGALVEQGRLHPAPAAPATPATDGARGPAQMLGDAWEWTASAYLPYPGFRIAPGAVGEYNGKFMSGQMVLRGGSCATPRAHLRITYRNFFPPAARWQFSAIRLAKDP